MNRLKTNQMKGERKMTDIEFILKDSGINNKVNALTESEKKFIKMKLLPHYERMSNPVFGGYDNIFNTNVGEFRKIKIAEIVEGLKNLVK